MDMPVSPALGRLKLQVLKLQGHPGMYSTLVLQPKESKLKGLCSFLTSPSCINSVFPFNIQVTESYNAGRVSLAKFLALRCRNICGKREKKSGREEKEEGGGISALICAGNHDQWRASEDILFGT